ncbi:TonB-dependent receptor [Muricauda sp. SCSIO 64092]|uniref:SusC/RagA family TonB-linked outer membrane protein n=1 Tax=Allomuricauda sp. SCSIO 64092 TaxID=2908842 RepID=UPI001FF6BBC5|nr:TonB-dependent receptor [Muricauda sp. SCSIO 64092]UOY04932.1 TonB-dependent receptor [Muricauda sp. SCSIO 64092]
MRALLFLCVTTVFSFSPRDAFSQNARIEIAENQTITVSQIFDLIQEQAGYRFVYSDEVIAKAPKVSVKKGTILARRLLKKGLSPIGCTYEITENETIIVKGPPVVVANAQQTTINGTVTDDIGTPLPGATILEKGTTNGTQTDFDGNFSIEVTGPNATLVVSYIGFVAQEVPLDGRTSVTVQLQEDTAKLDEVVVVGYGIQERKTLAGAITTVDAETFESRPVPNAVSSLQGITPGLIVTGGNGPGSQPNINIRGLSSLSGGGNFPLVLVDGFQSQIDNVNPDDIANISVIKDGAAAIYGNQASNGVILITTKKGRRNTAPQVQYSTIVGFTSPTYIPEKTTQEEYMLTVNEAFVNDGDAPLYGDIFFDALGTDTVLNFSDTRFADPLREDSYLIFNQPDNLFVDELLQNGIIQQHNLSIAGGGENNTYRVSLGYLSNEGVINSPFDSFDRYNLRINNDIQLMDNLKLSMQNALEIGDRSVSQQQSAALQRVVGNWTFQPVRNPDGQLYTFRGFANPLDLLEQGGETNTVTTRVISNLKLDYEIIDGLTLTGTAGINQNRIDRRSEQPTIFLQNGWTVDQPRVAGANPNRLSETLERENYFNLSGYLTYNKGFGNHEITATAGASHEQRKDTRFVMEARDFPFNDREDFSVQFGNDDEDRISEPFAEGRNDPNDNFGIAWTLRSWFGRFNYQYKNKYIAEATVRYDGSSRFTPDERWGLFTGYLGAWVASEEQFIRDLNVFDFLKFRASYGETGNQNGIGHFDFLARINTGERYIFGGVDDPLFDSQTPAQFYSEANAVSLDRTWETVATTNLGVDMALLGSRLNLSFDYFQRVNKDMLVGITLPEVLGIGPPALNRGELETKGFELSIGWNDKIGEDFSYYVRGALFNDDNKLVRLENSEQPRRAGVNDRLLGKSTGTLLGYQFDGLFQTDAEVAAYQEAVANGVPGGALGALRTGDVRYVDIDGNGEISELGNPENGDTGDLIELGNNRVQYSFSLDLGGQYKNFDFRALIQGVGQQDLFIDGRFRGPIVDGAWFVQGLRYYFGRTWSADNPNAQFPRLSTQRPINDYNYAPSSLSVLNGAYARLKNVQLGYSLPDSVLSSMGIEQLRLYVTGENVAEIQSERSRSLGFDPEKGSPSFSYPFVRTYSLGLQVTF